MTAEVAQPADVAGDERRTFARFVTTHRAAVEGAARRIVGRHAAEDVAQETFLRLWRIWPLDEQRALAVALVTARNLALNLRASHAVSRTVPRGEWEGDAAGIAPSAADPVLDADWWRRCRSVVDSLPAEQLAAILLEDDASLVELAHRSGLKPATLRQRRHRGVVTLREAARRAGLTAPSLGVLLRRPRRLGRRGAPAAALQGSVTIVGVMAVGVLLLPGLGREPLREVELPQPEAASGRPDRIRPALTATSSRQDTALTPGSLPQRHPPQDTAEPPPPRRRVPVEPPPVAVCVVPTACLGDAQRGDEVCLHPVQDFGPTCAKQAAVPVCDAIDGRTTYASCTRDPVRPPGTPAPA